MVELATKDLTPIQAARDHISQTVLLTALLRFLFVNFHKFAPAQACQKITQLFRSVNLVGIVLFLVRLDFQIFTHTVGWIDFQYS